MGIGVFGFFAIIVLVILVSSVKIVTEYERLVVFRLGKLLGTKGPGIVLVIPMVDQYLSISLRVITLDVPSQDIITKDNVTIKVNAVVYFRVVEPTRAITEVEQYLFATSQLAQTTLRSVVGQIDLDTLLSARDSINSQLQSILDQQTESWGVKISNVEVKQVDLPLEMQRAMAKQAEAERERRSKVIAAEGELQASHKLSEAAEVLERHPIAFQLRYLQTLREMSNEKTTNTIIPFPMDMLKGFLGKNS